MDKALKTMIANMPSKTGKTLDEWRIILESKTFAKHSEAVNYLKSEHSVTHGFANTIVSLTKNEEKTSEELIQNQYSGKESLLAIYKKLIDLVVDFGEDVKITPKKTEVSLDRSRKFGVIRPSTKSRIDLGLKLKGKPITNRLENSGPFGTMCTHRVRLTDVDQIDNEVIEWLEEAYLNAK